MRRPLNRPSRQRKWIRLSLVIAMLPLLATCNASPVPSACGWLKPVILDQGYATRLTTSEQRQIDALDNKIVEFCP